MSARLGDSFQLTIRKDGKTVVEKDDHAAEARLDVSTRLKRRKSKKVRVVKRGNDAIVR